MRRYIFFVVIMCSMFFMAVFSYLRAYYISLGISIVLISVFLANILQRSKPILRNYPVIGLMRSLLIFIRPILRQYILESYKDESPYDYKKRNVVYERATGKDSIISFGSEGNLYTPGSEWIAHSIIPTEPPEIDYVKIGYHDCLKPYLSSRINISAMGFATLSKNAVIALNLGAKLGGFSQNTGEDGICPHHLESGGDLVWQIGTGFSGCRTSDGNFDFNFFEKTSQLDTVKMIEIKLSQGAKPGVGGLFREFKTFEKFLYFVRQLRELSGGKPIGLKLCIGNPKDFLNLCDVMTETGILVDYFQIDGAEGGTIGASWELINHAGIPLLDGLAFVHNTLIKKGLRDKIKLLCSGKIATGFDIFRTIALGADICCVARGMLLALGCVQARKCKSGKCPVGIATQDVYRSKAISIEKKALEIANYHRATLHAFSELLGIAGINSTNEVSPRFIYRRLPDGSIQNYEQIYSKKFFKH